MNDVKVISVVAIIIAIGLALLGISKSEGSSPEATAEAQEMRTKIDHARKKTPDNELWGSARTATELISESIEGNNEYIIDITLETSDGETIVVECFETVDEINAEIREICKNRLALSIASSPKVEAAHERGESVKIVSTIMMRPTYNESGAGNRVYELCDSDNDGNWDTKNISV